MSDHPIFAWSSRFIDELADLRPILATALGVPGHDHRWGDHSPDGHAAVMAAWRRLRDRAAACVVGDDHWAGLARRVAIQAADEELGWYEEGEHLRDVSHMASFPTEVRDVFEMMDTSSEDGWAAVASRLETIDEPLAGYRATLAAGRGRGIVPAARQVVSVAEQLRSAVAPDGAVGRLTDELAASGVGGAGIGTRLAQALDHARASFLSLADHLETEVLPSADERDGVGRERYLRAARRHLGMALDPEEAYAWGWEHLRELMGEIRRVAAEIDPDRDLDGVAELLKNDPARAASSQEEFRELMLARQLQALEDLDGLHFDVPEPVRRIEVRTAPPGAPLGAWYVPPSEDWSRPGTAYWSFGTRRHIPLYEEISTGYHEAFPGHHLQVGVQVALSDRLSRLHRLLYWNPGYGEGWALYAERLMRELGYFEVADHVFGQLTGSLLRAVRVVADIGLHLDLPIPEDAVFRPGERWTFELAVEALERLAFLDHDYAVSEVTRYLGWPAQAISYKLGEREILRLRDEAERRAGGALDLKAFHARVLGSGSVGLDLLRELVLDAQP